MQGEWAEHRPTLEQSRRLVDRSPTQPHIGLHMGRNRELQEIVHSWSRDHRYLLTVAPELLIVSIARFAYCNQKACKLRHSVRLKKTISILNVGEADNSAPRKPELESPFPFPAHATAYELLGT